MIRRAGKRKRRVLLSGRRYIYPCIVSPFRSSLLISCLVYCRLNYFSALVLWCAYTWSVALSCDSCGRECASACGTRNFRTCCFNYLRKRSGPANPPGVRLELLMVSDKKRNRRRFLNREFSFRSSRSWPSIDRLQKTISPIFPIRPEEREHRTTKIRVSETSKTIDRNKRKIVDAARDDVDLVKIAKAGKGEKARVWYRNKKKSGRARVFPTHRIYMLIENAFGNLIFLIKYKSS